MTENKQVALATYLFKLHYVRSSTDEVQKILM